MKKRLFLVPLVALALLITVSRALAHERQVFQIGDKQYLFVVGSLNEPVFVDDKSGVDLRVELADPKDPGNSSSPNVKPVEGLEKTLKVEIAAGDKKKTFDLQPAYNDPGAYRAPFFPTIQTSYSYRFFGTIESIPVDLTFNCLTAGGMAAAEDKTVAQLSDKVSRVLKVGAFGCPLSKTGGGFPEPSVSLHELGVGAPSSSASSPLATTAFGLSVASLAIALIAWRRK